jgi:ABC-type multidrug transport system permease subunit
MPGVFAQTLAFGAVTTAVGVTYDLKKGLIDRFRSLPIAALGLPGRADLCRRRLPRRNPRGAHALRPRRGLAGARGCDELLAAVGLGLLFVYTMSWLGVWLGLLAPTVEVAQQAGFTVIFPVSFLSNVFVPTQTLPGFLRPVAEWNPVSVLTAAMRDLFGNPNPFGDGGFPTEHPVLLTLVWFAVLTAGFSSLGIRRYRAMSR